MEGNNALILLLLVINWFEFIKKRNRLTIINHDKVGVSSHGQNTGILK